jgi:hypothetical protein
MAGEPAEGGQAFKPHSRSSRSQVLGATHQASGELDGVWDTEGASHLKSTSWHLGFVMWGISLWQVFETRARHVRF